MGFYRNKDSQRAEMYEKKVSDRVVSDLGKTMNKISVLNNASIVTEHGEEILERIVKLEARIEELNFNINRIFILKDDIYGKLNQHEGLIDTIFKKIKAE